MGVVLIDPNEIDGQKVPKYEEMFLFVEFKAIRKEFTNLNNGQSSGMMVVGLMGYDQNTGEYSTRYTFNTLSPGERDKNAFEGFGITNISIKVNASQVPMVDVTFVDTRGAQFFNRSDSPYRILFDFPPPNYELTVKGYYGKGLTYKLHYVNSNNSFDYKTGNYTINAQFQAITFAPLADIPLAYLLAEPFFDDATNVVASLENGEPPRNTFELIAKAKRLYEKIDGLKNNSEDAKAIEEKTADTFDIEGGIGAVNRAFFNFNEFKDVRIVGIGDSITNEIKQEVDFPITQYPYNIARYFYDFASHDDAQNRQFIDNLKTLSQGVSQIPRLGEEYKKITVEYFETNGTVPVKSEAIGQFFSASVDITAQGVSFFRNARVTRIDFNIKPLIDFIKAEKEKNDNLIKQSEDRIAQEATKVLTDYFGTMKPTIGNIMKILCDDADKVFIRLNDVAIEAREHHKQYKTEILGRASAINNFNLRTEAADVFPFPYYVSKEANTTDGEVSPRTSVRGWIGKAFGDLGIPPFPEVTFVENYIRATFRQKDQQESLEAIEDVDAEGNATWFPLSPIDYRNIASSSPDLIDNPYLTKGNIDDIIRTLVNRLIVYETVFYGGVNDATLKSLRNELIKIEASNIGAGITDENLLTQLEDVNRISSLLIRFREELLTTSNAQTYNVDGRQISLPILEASDKIQLLPNIDSTFITEYTNEDNRGNINTLIETFTQKGGLFFGSDTALGVKFSKKKLFYYELPDLTEQINVRLKRVQNYTGDNFGTVVRGFLIDFSSQNRPIAEFDRLINHLNVFGTNAFDSSEISLATNFLNVLTSLPAVLVANKLLIVYLYAGQIKKLKDKNIILQTKQDIINNRQRILNEQINPYALEIFNDTFEEFKIELGKLLENEQANNAFTTALTNELNNRNLLSGNQLSDDTFRALTNTNFYKYCITRVIIYSPGNQTFTLNFGSRSNPQFRTSLINIPSPEFSEFKTIISQTIKENSQKRKNEITQKRVEREQFIKNNDIKQRLYQGFKSLYDRWLIGTKQGRGQVHEFFGTSLYDCFKFVDRGNNDISQECFISLQPLLNFENNPDVSLFTVLSQLLSYNGFEFFPIQNFMGFDQQSWLESFRVTPTLRNIVTRPTFVCMYMGGASNFLDNPNSLFKNDGFSLSDGEAPDDINNSPADVNAFVVAYGKQNQSYFKDIQVSSTEHRETNESLQILSTLARDTSNTAPEPVGQNLYQIYEQRSYTAGIEMLGNMMIQPTMYFDLRNVPLYSGAYMVIEVEHNIVPNYMTTKFKGVRLAKFPQPFVSNFTASVGLSAGGGGNPDNTDINYSATNNYIASVNSRSVNPNLDNTFLRDYDVSNSAVSPNARVAEDVLGFMNTKLFDDIRQVSIAHEQKYKERYDKLKSKEYYNQVVSKTGTVNFSAQIVQGRSEISNEQYKTSYPNLEKRTTTGDIIPIEQIAKTFVELIKDKSDSNFNTGLNKINRTLNKEFILYLLATIGIEQGINASGQVRTPGGFNTSGIQTDSGRWIPSEANQYIGYQFQKQDGQRRDQRIFAGFNTLKDVCKFLILAKGYKVRNEPLDTIDNLVNFYIRSWNLNIPNQQSYDIYKHTGVYFELSGRRPNVVYLFPINSKPYDTSANLMESLLGRVSVYYNEAFKRFG